MGSLARRLRRSVTLLVALVALLAFGVIYAVGRAELFDELDAALHEDWVALAGQAAAVQARTGAQLQPQAWFDTVSFRPDYQPEGERFYLVLDPQRGEPMAFSPSVPARGLVPGTAALAGEATRRFETHLPDGTRVSLLSRALPVVGVQPERDAAVPGDAAVQASQRGVGRSEAGKAGLSQAEAAQVEAAPGAARSRAGESAAVEAESPQALRRVDPVLLVGRTHAVLDERLTQLAWVCAAGVLLLPLLVASLLGPMLPWLLGPLRALSKAAAQSGPGHPARVPRSALRELRPISDRINQLVAEHDACRYRERRLLDDTAQELRTPLSELQALADVTLLRTHDPRLQAEAMGQVRRIAQRMNGQVDLLFLLARHAGGAPPLRMAVALAELVGAALAEARPSNEGRSLQWHCDGEAEVPVWTDRALAQALLDHLLAQVLAQARPGAEVRLAWGRVAEAPHLASVEIAIGSWDREAVAEIGAAVATARRAAQVLGATLHAGSALGGIGARLVFGVAPAGGVGGDAAGDAAGMAGGVDADSPANAHTDLHAERHTGTQAGSAEPEASPRGGGDADRRDTTPALEA